MYEIVYIYIYTYYMYTYHVHIYVWNQSGNGGYLHDQGRMTLIDKKRQNKTGQVDGWWCVYVDETDIYVYVFMYVCMYVCIYIYIERERYVYTYIYIYMNVYAYIYIYILLPNIRRPRVWSRLLTAADVFEDRADGQDLLCLFIRMQICCCL